MMNEQSPPLRIPLHLARPGRWRIAGCHPARPEFPRIARSQEQLLAGETDFDLKSLTHAGLFLPMLRPESGVVLELRLVRGS
jgi:alpha-galactosidase